MAADEVKTLREASIAFGGVQRQLSLMTAVFAATVALGVLGLGTVYSKAGTLAEILSRVETRLGSIELLLKETRDDQRAFSQRMIDDVARIKGALRITAVEPEKAQPGIATEPRKPSESTGSTVDAPVRPAPPN